MCLGGRAGVHLGDSSLVSATPCRLSLLASITQYISVIAERGRNKYSLPFEMERTEIHKN